MPSGAEVEPIHVLSLVEHLGSNSGGAERMARELTASIDGSRFRRTLCVTRLAEEERTSSEVMLIEELEARGVQFLYLGRRSTLQLGAWRPLVNFLRRENVRILHGHMFGSNVWAATLGPAARVPVIIAHEHGWSYEGQPLRRFLDRELIARSCDAIIASSELARERMIAVEGIDPERTNLVYIRNGIVKPRPTGRGTRAEFGLSEATPLVLAVARLDPYKALHVLIDAAARLSPEFPDVRILIAGEGPDRRRLAGLIADRQLQDVVTLLGSRSDVPDLIAACDVATLSSYSETTPLAIMEYMALGKPVVATRVGGIPDLIEDGVNGLLVEPHDPDALAEGIASLLRDPERARILGRRGRERQVRDFSIDAVARRVESLYDALLERPRPRRPHPLLGSARGAASSSQRRSWAKIT